MSEDIKWVKPWCKMNLDELEDYRGFVVAVHPEHGIINAARNVATLHEQLEFTKRKVRAKVAVVYTSDYLPPLDDARMEDDDGEEPVPEDPDPPPPLAPPVDLFDTTEITLDGSRHPEAPIEAEHGLAPLPNDGPGPEKATPFPSKDPQPPFTPRRDLSNLRVDGVMHPGARGSWGGRGPRYD